MQSEQESQWRRERKRLKREEKRRNRRPRPGDPTILLQALPPMGVTLLEYARPLMNRLPADHGPDEVQALLAFASMFWNSVLDEDEVDEAIPIIVRKLVKQLQMSHTEANRLSEALLDRRVQLFGHDPRIVTNVEVARDTEGLRVRARSTVLGEDLARLRGGSETANR
jgi:hypothetical protein